EPRNQEFGMPMLLCEAEGNTEHGVIRQSCSDPARSETLCTSGPVGFLAALPVRQLACRARQDA
ncbi:hypothetical protein DND58_28050, partial [Pseudomonas syringae pv. pisi]